MLLESTKSEINSKIIGFSLKGVDGKIHNISDYKDKSVLVIIFMCNHCPYVKAVIARFISFQKKYSERDVTLIGINPNATDSYPEDSYENMILFAKEHTLNFPYLIDETQETAKKYDAVCTPDIYVYNKERILKYRGRFDDNWKDKPAVNSRDLERAVELILGGKDVDFKQIPSMGCSIKWKV